ncbi:MAG: copper homeostasis protein CutC [Gemmataceae bacterium]
MPKIVLEVAIESIADAQIAFSGGADRLELCSALDLGGLTPSLGMYEEIRLVVPIPIVVMIRPRSGDFVYDEDEIGAMRRDIEHFLPFKPDGFVFGVLTPDATIHESACRKLTEAAQGTPCIFHRAFDKTRNNRQALEECVSLGFTRVLSSGRASTALSGLTNLQKLHGLAQGRIGILPCGKVRALNVGEILRMADFPEVHGSFAEPLPEPTDPGATGYVRRSRTSRDAVAACRAVLDTIALAKD